MLIACLIATVAGSSIATWLYVARLLQFDTRQARAGHAAMGLGTSALLVSVVIALVAPPPTMAIGPTIVLFVALGAAFVGLIAQTAWRTPLFGPIAGAIVAVTTLAVLFKVAVPAPAVAPAAVRTVTILHISATILGFLSFVPAFVLSALYVGQIWRLKTKQLAKHKHGPSLVGLELYAWRFLVLGFPLYTVGILLGLVWQDSAAVGIRPRQVFAAVSWLIFAVIIWRRARTGWRGVRAATSVMTGFVVTLGAVLLYTLR